MKELTEAEKQACWNLAQEILTDYVIASVDIDSLSESIQIGIECWFQVHEPEKME